jgi:hypothetical protein
MDTNIDALYFSNPNYGSKSSSNISLHKKDSAEPYDKKEYKFYKKRIFQLVKDIMQKNNKDIGLKHHFDTFIVEAIEYLKFKDKSLILQEEYLDISLSSNSKSNSVPDISNDDVNNNANTTKLDTLLYTNLDTKPNTIESYMKIIKHKREPIKSKNNPVHIPKKKAINLRDEKFKTRGLNKNKHKHKKVEKVKKDKKDNNDEQKI